MQNNIDIINSFLSGHDAMERIISIECGYDDDQVSIIFINKNGEKRIKLDDFKPFVWAKNSAAIRMFNGNRNELKHKMQEFGIGVKALTTKTESSETSERLENGYKYIFYAKRKMSYQKFLIFFKIASTPIYGDRSKKNITEKIISTREFLAVSPVEQYMIYSGKRMFKGYDNYDDLKRLQFDLETQGLNPEVHAIDQIGIRTNKGFERIITVTGVGEERKRNELRAIIEFISILAEEKPDVIAGHNSENFDWNFIIVRCKVLGTTLEDISLKFFKHPIYKKNKETVLKLGGEVEYYKPTIMWGHNIVDSLHAVRRAQAIDSNMKLANLKYVTRYLDLKKDNRVYVPGNQIGTIWLDTNEKSYAFNNLNGDWYKITEKRPLLDGYEYRSGKYVVERYLLDDIWETDKVELTLNESNFLIGKILPTTFQRACTMGTAGIWKLILLAWCYEKNLAVPSFAPSKRFTGGLSRLLKVGYADRVVKLDYNSLYPSIILTWNIGSKLDILNSMLMMLEYVLSEREKYKGLKGKAGKKAKEIKEKLKSFSGTKEERHELENEQHYWEANESANDKKQLPLKILANSFFGSFGAPDVFPMGDVICAEKTTCIGRMSLRLMISHFTNIGYTPIVGDSVTYDTPIIVKHKETNKINILPICDIFNNSEQIEFDDEQYRDFTEKPYLVLTRDGFKDISYVYKHKTNKSLHRIETKNGLIDVTEDHSLFDGFKNEIKPKDLKRGDSIEVYSNDISYNIDDSITPNKAWVFGFFMADGSSVYCDRKQKYFSKRRNEFVIHKGKRANWKISNKTLERLEQAKKILVNDFNINCSIKNHLASSNVYDLVVDNVQFAKYFSEEFYTSYRYKKVPELILNSSLEVKKAFIDGFCCGDGQGDTLEECVEFGQKSKVAMAGLYMILKELNVNFRLHTRKDKPEFISFVFKNHRGNPLNENYSKREEDEVWNNNLITSKNEYVYDISADGTFVNALGLIMCHNTDGFNFQMPKSFRYTKENPYIGKGLGRNTVKGKEYTDVEADVAEFEDLYLNHPFNGGVNKMGLGIDEYCPATINFSRKNYADLLENGKTKKVGNTIKSRRMSGYIEKFLDDGIDLLLKGNGQKFLENYYDYIDKIFNYQMPLRDIASKGKIKKTVEEYKKDCETVTKAGSKKSRQAWYELVIQDNVKVEINDTIYYINTGSKKSETDVKRITHKYAKINGEIVEIDNKVRKELIKKEYGDDFDIKTLSAKDLKEIIKKYVVKEEDEIILNCKLVPNEIIDSDEDILCNDDFEYNVVKYIEQFNKRIKPLLVCFSNDIREKILIQNPKDRQYFTEEQCKLVSGFPYKDIDQDTYEQLMTPERKEIEYWLSINEIPPFVNECGIDWEKLVEEYHKTIEQENNAIFQEENAKYLDALNSLTKSDIDDFNDDGTIPQSLSKIVTLGADMHFRFIKLPSMCPSTGGYIFDDLLTEDDSEKEYEKFVENYNEQ